MKPLVFKLAVLVAFFFTSFNLESQIITTVAGGYLGNNVNAKTVGISPISLATDKYGNVYYGDLVSNTVRKYNPKTGINTVVAGNGSSGYSGDGGPATNAQLYGVFYLGVALDTSGNIYIDDYTNYVVREVNAVTGIITTIAGNNILGASGDGGPATNASITSNSIALDDSGNIYLCCNYSPYTIREISAATGIIRTIAGEGTSLSGVPATNASIGFAQNLTVDKKGNVYIMDPSNDIIQEIVASTKMMTIAAGTRTLGFSGDGGPATNAEIKINQGGITCDKAGNVYFSDDVNERIREIDAVTGIITTIAGTGSIGYAGDGGPALSANMYYPQDLAFDTTGNLYLVDLQNYVIREIEAPSNTIYTVAGNHAAGFNGNGIPATNAELFNPYGLCLDTHSNIYVCNYGNNRIMKINASSGNISTYAGNNGLGFNGDSIPADSAYLNYPTDVAIYNSDLYIADFENNRVRIVDAGDSIYTYAGNGLSGFSGNSVPATSAKVGPYGLAVDALGNLYIADINNSRIRKVDHITGLITTVAGNGVQGYSGDGGPATTAELWWPVGVAVDNSGNIYIADCINQRIRKVDNTTGYISTIAGNGMRGFSGDNGSADSAELNFPNGVAIDPLGRLFISDSWNNRIRMVDLKTDTISTIVGNGVRGYSGDGGIAINAELDYPNNIAFDALDNMYIADMGNNRVRKISAPLGINNIYSNASIIIYPNPSKGIFNINVSSSKSKLSIYVYNMLGEKIYTTELNSTNTQIDLGNNASGIYLYRVIAETGDLISTGKIVIQK